MLKKRIKEIQAGGGYAKRKRMRLFVSVFLIFLIFVIAVVAGSFLSKAGFVQITSIEIAGAKTVSVEDIHAVAEGDIAGSWWYVFSKNNLVLYPKRTIETDLLAKYPTLSAVSFSMESLHTLRIYVTERDPYALACNDISESSECFYVDPEGIVFAVAPQFSNGVYIRYAVASSSVAIGQTVTNPARFAFLKYVTEYISKMNLHVSKVSILPDNDYIVELQTPLTLIYMNDIAPKEKTMTYFGAFWSSQSDKNFKYIDLRFDKNIIYKL